jgi:hypothetical protein
MIIPHDGAAAAAAAAAAATAAAAAAPPLPAPALLRPAIYQTRLLRRAMGMTSVLMPLGCKKRS